MSKKKTKNKYKNKTKQKSYSYSYASPKDIDKLALQVFGSYYYTQSNKSDIMDA
jgi:hypothetical protein